MFIEVSEISVNVPNIGRQVLLCFSTMEDRHIVAQPNHFPHDERTNEFCAAEDEDVHCVAVYKSIRLARSRRASRLDSVNLNLSSSICTSTIFAFTTLRKFF